MSEQQDKDSLDNFDVFYMELPQADYLDDIEIQDEYDSASSEQIQGLSDQQVSEIARDSINASPKPGVDVEDNGSKPTPDK